MNAIVKWGAERVITSDPSPSPAPTPPYIDIQRFGDFLPQIVPSSLAMIYWERTATSPIFSSSSGSTDATLRIVYLDAAAATPTSFSLQQGGVGLNTQFEWILEVATTPNRVAWIGFGTASDPFEGYYTLQFYQMGAAPETYYVDLGSTRSAVSNLSLVALGERTALVYTRQPSGFVAGGFSDDTEGFSSGVYAQILGKVTFPPPPFGVRDDVPEFRVNAITTGAQSGSTAIALGTNLLVIWNDNGTSILGKIFDPFGGIVLADTPLVTAAVSGKPVAVVLDDGNFAIAWTQDGDVYARVLTPTGVAVSDAVRVNDNTANNQELPKITASVDGGFVVLFSDSSFSAPDTNDAALLAQKFDAAGVKSGVTNLLVPTTLAGDHINHDIMTLMDGRIAVTWSSTSDASTRLLFLDDRGVQLEGSARADIIYGADDGSPYAHNIFVLGEGNDLAYGLGGNDYVYGGAGIDTARGGNGVDVLLGEDGDDQLFGEGDNDYLYGGVGADAMNGGDGVDVLIGEDGNDTGYGGNGGDYFYLGIGQDTAFGDEGNDIFIMDAGNDYARGDAGQDYFYMGAGSDTMEGGAGVDVLLGESGNDVFFGSADVDYLFLGPGGPGDDDAVVVDASVSGIQVINGFEAGGSNDVINIRNGTINSFAGIEAATADFTSSGGFMVISLDADSTIWLLGVAPSQLSASDFFLG